MAEDSSSAGESISRRKYLIGAGSAGIAGLAGCSGGSGGNSTEGSGGSSGGTTAGGSGGAETDSGASNNAQPGSPLTADGSSTVYPITSDGASVWNSNPQPSDKEYWGPSQYGIKTDKRLADYWAGRYGFSDGDNTQPPFLVNIGLSHSGTGVTKVMEGQVDIGDSSAPVSDELPDLEQSKLDKFVDHVVGVDGQPVVVSREVKDAGVKVLDIQTLKKIYKGEIENWKNVPDYNGEPKEIQVIGRAVGSGTDTAFRSNVFGNPDASIPGVDIRKGQNQQVQQLVSQSNNAIAYLALAFVQPEGQVPPVGIRIDGTTYKYGDNLGAKGYPLSRDLHCYTYNGTSKKEAAFLRMLIHDFGQENFVAPNNYFKLPQDRQQNQLNKLPDPTSGGSGSGSSGSSQTTSN